MPASSPISPESLRLALAALKLQIEPLRSRDGDLQSQWSRASGRVAGIRAGRALAERIADLRAEGAGKLADLNRARVEIEDALERGSW